MPTRKLTQEQIDKIALLREQGSSITEIAKAFDLKYQTVSGICLEVGADAPETATAVKVPATCMVAKRGNHQVRRFTPEEDAEILKLEADGLGPKQIGDVLGRNHSSIKNRQMTLARHQERAFAASQIKIAS